MYHNEQKASLFPSHIYTCNPVSHESDIFQLAIVLVIQVIFQVVNLSSAVSHLRGTQQNIPWDSKKKSKGRLYHKLARYTRILTICCCEDNTSILGKFLGSMSGLKIWLQHQFYNSF